MKKTHTNCIAWLVYMAALSASAAQAQDSPKPAGQKDGINLYIRYSESFDRKYPIVVCDLENTTDKPVSFQLQGAAEGDGYALHLIDEDGKEIEKTAEWLRLYETGDSLHTRYGVIKAHSFLGPVEMELVKAYGPKWASGARLDIDWNSREPRREPGPFGGQFGIGSGVKGSLDLTPLTGKKVLAKLEPQQSNSIEKRTEENPISDEAPPPPPLPQTTNGFASYGISWAWIIGAVIVLLVGAFWLGAKSTGRSH